MALDHEGNILIADALYHRIRRVTPDGTITTIAGDGIPSFLGDGGPATDANLQYPTGVTPDHDGNLFIADAGNHRIRRIDPDGTITTVAGTGAAGFAGDGGPATDARLHKPTGVAVSRKGELFIADEYNHRIRRVGTHGRISTVAGATEFPPHYDGFVPGDYGGDGGPATEAFLNFPTEVLLDGDQNLLIADSSNHRVRSVDRDGIITTIAGGGSRATGRRPARHLRGPGGRPHRHGVRRRRGPARLRGARPSCLEADANRHLCPNRRSGRDVSLRPPSRRRYDERSPPDDLPSRSPSRWRPSRPTATSTTPGASALPRPAPRDCPRAAGDRDPPRSGAGAASLAG